MELTKLLGIELFSQEFTFAPTFVQGRNRLFLKYDYELEAGGYAEAGITFLEAIGYKKTAGLITPSELVKAYDSICVASESGWLKEAKKEYRGSKPFEYKHYVLYFEDYGCYEVLAKDVQIGVLEKLI